MIRFLLLMIHLYYCLGYLQDETLPGDPKMETLPPDDDDYGEPLFLTPFIENGQILEAQKRAHVKLHNFEHIESYSGFLTVNKTYNTNLFFWYFPANGTSPFHNPYSAEVVIYLTSSLFNEMFSMHGLFQENGPIRILSGSYGIYAEERKWPLNKHRHVIYIDHSPGMGFSFTDDLRGYPDSSMKIGELLYTATFQIFKLFPVLSTKYLCIMGEMVGAKYAATLAYLIDKHKTRAEIDIKLQRLYLISPWIDPINQVGYYHKHAYDVGLIDGNMAEELLTLQKIIQFLLFKRQSTQALSFYLILCRELTRVTGRDQLSNLSDDKGDFANYNFYFWISKSSRRKALHVGGLDFKTMNKIGEDALKNDHMESVQYELSILAKKGYIIFLANGPLSIIVPFRAMYETMKNIDDRTNIVDEGCIVDLVDKTYQAYLYFGGIENSQTVAVLQQKVGNFPWIDKPEMTWRLVDFIQDFVPSGVGEEHDYDSLSGRLVYKKLNTNKKGNFNHFWGSTQ